MGDEGLRRWKAQRANALGERGFSRFALSTTILFLFAAPAPATEPPITSIAFDPDGKSVLRPGDHVLPMVASASEDKTVRLWQPTIGRMVRFSKLKSEPLDADWLPDGSRRRHRSRPLPPL